MELRDYIPASVPKRCVGQAEGRGCHPRSDCGLDLSEPGAVGELWVSQLFSVLSQHCFRHQDAKWYSVLQK